MVEKIISKQHTVENILSTVTKWKADQQRIVFTNGCFDLIHYGHLHYLAEAAALGDRLIVALNADASVRRLKGNNRPIKDEKNRLFLMASLACVDAALLFHEDTPAQLIDLIIPDVLVKGGDWSVDQIVGSDTVLKNGGIVKSLSFLDGYSTTALIEKINSNH